MFSIFEVIGEVPPVRIVDVGAMAVGDGREPYSALVEGGHARVTGFEPVAAECEKLNAMHGSTHTILPYWIGSGERGRFHLTNAPMTSSLFEPNLELVSKFENLAGLMRVVSVDEVETLRLDDVPEARAGADYLKLDVQGAELDVLSHGCEVLAEVAVVHTEVEFVALYREQPLFADVDGFLRSQGFAFHRILGFGGRPFRPFIRNNDPNSIVSQQLWAEVVYVKDFMALERLPAEKLLAMAVVLHELYQSVDLCHVVLRAHDAAADTELAARYLARFGAGG